MSMSRSRSMRLGEQSVDVTEVLAAPTAKFRLEFTHDVRAKEMRWVLFTSVKRGAVGKLIFTLEKDGSSAHVKSIAINKEWRGYGLARILYLACISTLAELKVQELNLEAEEDSKRHGKLVGLYRSWGFQEIPDAKILFLYNDNECFRKVPMTLSFRARDFFPSQPQKDTWFCMLTLKTSDGTCLVAAENGAIQARKEKTADALWQTLLGRNGEIFLRSAHGKFLCVEDSGTVLADRPWNSTWETFQVVPYHDELDVFEEPVPSNNDQAKHAIGGVALKDFHGSYLCIDSNEHKVVSSSVPVPWDGGDIMSLVCDKTDSTPLYAKIMRKYQTLEFVKKQIEKHSAFNHASMSILDAYQALMVLTGDSEAPAQSWLLHHMLATAENAREDGHPDWFQLVVFLRGFGMLFLLWADDENGMLRSISANEWMVSNSTWVVGHAIPDQIEFPELNVLNADHCSAEKNPSSSAESGMHSVFLPWTPDEYLYRVLDFNKTSLPSEAVQALRFWSLRVWHRGGCYEGLCVPQDADTKEWLSAISNYTFASKEKMKNVSPETLMPYYIGLAHKYLPEQLQW
ncbi:hypothetical protein Poli38472_014103 [Pythium oligandrum]|uniref:Inositol oxygenase n=1 Tax=Pythium oligandrum TaxID=41045 RepID=A0A8K1CQE1_PYTOL|nr:hypothetical protein Poli38472_014103 [Pythium oligandrum]|eukprot:TMW66791.1 hypothetical protein Poli38472_014103 [Pythium oligandrum]